MTKALDPVTLEVIRNALPAVANEMAVDLQRTSYNMMIYEVRDFCTALVNTAGELICQNVGGVSHFVADLGVVITDGMRRYGRQGFAPGDMKSQMAACRLAARRMDELFGKYGRETMLEAIARIFDETEAKCRNVVSQLADGVYEAAAALDEDGVTRGEPVPIRAKVTIDHGAMTIDPSGCSQEPRGAINSRTFAGARVAYKALTGPLDPVNEGSFRALKVIIPEGNVMMARFPAPMSSWSVIVPMVVDTIVAALAPAMPERVPAGHHGLLGGAVVFFGTHPQTNRRFVVQSIEGGGWGGRPFEDGESGTVSVCQGDVRNGSIEGIELKCPVLVEGRALRTDSGGAGKYRGGLGIDMRVRNLVEGKWNFELVRRNQCPPWGLWGGEPGEYGMYLVSEPGEREFRVAGGAHQAVPVRT